MAVFCHYWRITPEQFWDLDMHEYTAMGRYMDKQREAEEDAALRAKHPGGKTTLAAMAAQNNE